jgi:hypothetical protein
MTLKHFLESIDIFGKFSKDEYRVPTARGATLSLAVSLLGSLLLSAQVLHFAVPDLTRSLGASRTVPGEAAFVNITLAILVLSPCDLLRFDAPDSIGFVRPRASTVTMRRHARNGTLLGHAAPPGRSGCGPCFGVRPK